MMKNGTVFCNICGEALDFWDKQEDFSIHKDHLGYGTAHDGDTLDLHICCSCLDKLVDSCKVSPISDTHQIYMEGWERN